MSQLPEGILQAIGGIIFLIVICVTGYQIVMYGPVWVKCAACVIAGGAIVLLAIGIYVVHTWRPWG